eukprot:g9779.t1
MDELTVRIAKELEIEDLNRIEDIRTLLYADDVAFYLGCVYADCDDLVRDVDEAIKWWRKAAAQGHATAQERLEENGAALFEWEDKADKGSEST